MDTSAANTLKDADIALNQWQTRTLRKYVSCLKANGVSGRGFHAVWSRSVGICIVWLAILSPQAKLWDSCAVFESISNSCCLRRSLGLSASGECWGSLSSRPGFANKWVCKMTQWLEVLAARSAHPSGTREWTKRTHFHELFSDLPVCPVALVCIHIHACAPTKQATNKCRKKGKQVTTVPGKPVVVNYKVGVNSDVKNSKLNQNANLV